MAYTESLDRDVDKLRIQMYTYRMDIKQVVFVVGMLILLICVCVWAIFRLLDQVDSLHRAVREAGKRYEQLYTAYAEACNSNPNRPRMTTMSQEQWYAMNPAKSATEFDLRKQGSRFGQKT